MEYIYYKSTYCVGKLSMLYYTLFTYCSYSMKGLQSKNAKENLCSGFYLGNKLWGRSLINCGCGRNAHTL